MRYITTAGKTIVAKEDRHGRPIIAWKAQDDFGKSQVYVMQWFGKPAEFNPETWVTLEGRWEAFGGSSVDRGITTATNNFGVYTFDLAIDSDDYPVVTWVERRATGRLYLLRWSATNWAEVGGSFSNGIANILVDSSSAELRGVYHFASTNGLTNGTVFQYSITNWFDRCGVAVDTQNQPVVTSLLAASPTAVQVRRFNGTNWVGIGSSATDSGITGQGGYYNPLIAIGSDGRPVVTYWSDWTYYCRKWDGVSSWPQLGGAIAQVDDYNGAYDQCALALGGANLVSFAWLEYWAQIMSNNVTLPPKHGLWVRRYNGSAWTAIGASASYLGLHKDISSEISCRSLGVACRGTDEVFVSWAQWNGTSSPFVFARRSAGTNWSNLGGSWTNTGINESGADALAVAGLCSSGSPIVAYARQWSGNAYKLDIPPIHGGRRRRRAKRCFRAGDTGSTEQLGRR